MDKEIGAIVSISNDLAGVIVKRLYPHFRERAKMSLAQGAVQNELIKFMCELLEKADFMTKAHEVDTSEEFDTHKFEGEKDAGPPWLDPSKFPPKPEVGTYGGSINGDGVWIDDNGRPHFRDADGWIEVRSFPPSINSGALVEVSYGGSALHMGRTGIIHWGSAKRFRFL